MASNDESCKSLTLRLYQQAILDTAIESNTIALLPTGSGKTLIACHLILSRIRHLRLAKRKYLSDENRNKKLIIFIAPTKVLLTQQLSYFQIHFDNNFVKNVKVTELNV